MYEEILENLKEEHNYLSNDFQHCEILEVVKIENGKIFVVESTFVEVNNTSLMREQLSIYDEETLEFIERVGL